MTDLELRGQALALRDLAETLQANEVSVRWGDAVLSYATVRRRDGSIGARLDVAGRQLSIPDVALDAHGLVPA